MSNKSMNVLCVIPDESSQTPKATCCMISLVWYFLQRNTHMTNSGSSIWEWQESFTEKEQVNLRADKTVLYFDCVGGYMITTFVQTLRTVH